ncbi:MAG: lytic transglycosylase domain-containing protein [Bauldia sp.]|nr:lytic transglycosylase domain-containing protein [Bauldia sp.]
MHRPPFRATLAFASGLSLAMPAALAQDAPVPIPNPLRDLHAAAAVEAAGPPLDPAVQAFLDALPEPDLLLRSAYRQLRAGEVATATRIARSMPDKTGGMLIDWLIASEGLARADYARIAEAMVNVATWPGQVLMQLRYEQALLRGEPDHATVIAAMEGRQPVLDVTKLALAAALRAGGRDGEAAELIRPLWRDGNLARSTEDRILESFGDLLTTEDHRFRMQRLLYDGFNDEALRTAEQLSSETQALAAAWVAVNRNSGNAASLMAAVPETLRNDPGYLYARLRMLMRAGERSAAVTLLAGAPRDPLVLVDPDAWSQQRRTLARSLVDRGNPQAAYEVLAGHSAVDRLEVVEVAFQAGWVALTQLDRPDLAVAHFAALGDASSLPLSQSRSAYWLGRSNEALGQIADATAAYERAAHYATTFYGQLAAGRLGRTTLDIAPAPAIDEAAATALLDSGPFKAMVWLDAFDEGSDAALFARFLADTLPDAASIALLAATLEAEGEHQLAVQVGKLAANRDLPVDAIAFPMAAIPATALGAHIDVPLVYAVARQESSFNSDAVSSAGAVGMLQLLPSTAEEMARAVGLPFSEARLASDPIYNATLGSAYLGRLISQYRGSIVLALAAYNAGFTRADAWIATYGDPRDPSVDTIDWIERIPFDETRNYVQRVLENLQVYRALLGDPTLWLPGAIGAR